MFSDPQGLLNQPWTDQEVIAIATRKGRSLIYSDHTKYCKCIGVLWSITHITVPLLHQNEPFLGVWSQGCWRDGRPGTPLTITAAQLPAFINQDRVVCDYFNSWMFLWHLSWDGAVVMVSVVVSSVLPGIRLLRMKVFFTAQEGKFTQRGRNIKIYASHSISLNYEFETMNITFLSIFIWMKHSK